MITQENRSEIEFLVELEGDIVPVEVKSGSITRAKSLRKYIDKYHPRKSIILSAKPMHFNEDAKILHLPLYLADRVLEI